MNLKQNIKLFIPPLFYPSSIRNLYTNFFKEKNKFEYEINFFTRHSFILKSIMLKNKDCKYLEIGVSDGEVFNTIPLKIENKIGVDPNKGGTHRMTSDIFFSSNKKKFDFIYIDGLHTYEQAINDIKNSLNFLNENGIILLHDCLPKKIWNQIVPRIYGHWNGDVWKAIVESRTWENTNTFTIIADHGLGLIQKKKNSNILKDKISDFKKLKYRDYYEKHILYMNPIQHQDLIKYI